MRPLLLLALLFRLAPVPPGAEHCAAERPVAGVAVHHHDGGSSAPAERSSAPAHDECPHCPPADCVRQTQCAQGVGTFAPLAAAPVFAAARESRTVVRLDHPVLASITASPPTPPPVPPLA